MKLQIDFEGVDVTRYCELISIDFNNRSRDESKEKTIIQDEIISRVLSEFDRKQELTH